jgi:hypothetical protein
MGLKPRPLRGPVDIVAPVALRRGLAPVDVVALALGRAREPLRSDTLRHIAAVVDDATLVALAGALRRGEVPALPLVAELIARGFVDDAVALTDEPWFGDLRAARDRAPRERWQAWIPGGVARFRDMRARSDVDSVTLLTAAETVIDLLPPAERDAAVDDLFAQYQRDVEAGWYDELDYPYGEIDPTLRMARTFLFAGRSAAAVEALTERDGRYPALLNFDEVESARGIIGAMPSSLRSEWYWRLRDWAKRSDDDNYRDGRYECTWLVEGHDLYPDAVESRLPPLIAEATTPGLLRAITHRPALPAGLRARAAAKAVELVEALVPRAARAKPSAHGWQLRAGVGALADASALLTDAQRARLSPSAVRWARWFTGDGRNATRLEVLQTAIDWARVCPDEMVPVADALLERIRRGDLYVLRRRRWDRLYSDERVRSIVATV